MAIPFMLEKQSNKKLEAELQGRMLNSNVQFWSEEENFFT